MRHMLPFRVLHLVAATRIFFQGLSLVLQFLLPWRGITEAKSRGEGGDTDQRRRRGMQSTIVRRKLQPALGPGAALNAIGFMAAGADGTEYLIDNIYFADGVDLSNPVPAPGSIALLGLAGALAHRRR